MEVVDIDKASSYINDPDFGLIENESSWDSSSFTSFVRKKNTFSYVIYEKTKIVGFLLVESDPDSTKIEKLTVHPKYRRLTFGSLLLNHLIQKAFSPKIVVYCKENDSDSIAFYKSKKFKSNLAKSHPRLPWAILNIEVKCLSSFNRNVCVPSTATNKQQMSTSIEKPNWH
jgi:ribosomal protein S18 acetylase RimI-like enzyme